MTGNDPHEQFADRLQDAAGYLADAAEQLKLASEDARRLPSLWLRADDLTQLVRHIVDTPRGEP